LSDAGPAPPVGEMSFVPAVDGEESDVAGEVVVVLAGEVLWVGEDVDEAAAVDVALDDAECAVRVHVGSALGGSAFFLAAPSELELVLVLGLGEVGVVVGVTLGLTLGLTDGLGLVLALAEALALALAAVLLLWLPLDDVAGAGAVPVALLAGLVVVVVTAGCVDDDVQGLGEVRLATPGLLDPGPSPVEGWGALVPPPSVVAPALAELLLLLPVIAELRASPTETVHCRAGGTEARTTPTANTVTPRAKAGRSIASRQSRCRCGAGFCGADFWGAGRPPRPGTRRRASPAAKPEIASQRPSAPLGWLARAGRDRIFSRIRSRPSAPGST